MDSTKRVIKNGRKLKTWKSWGATQGNLCLSLCEGFRTESQEVMASVQILKNMFKRLRLKIKKQRRARRNEEISKCLNKLEYLRHQEGNRKETGYKTHTKLELFLAEKIRHSEISKLESNNDLKDWNLPLKQMLGMKMFHHVYYSEVFLNWPHCLQSFSLRDRGSSQAWESARGTGTP